MQLGTFQASEFHFFFDSFVFNILVDVAAAAAVVVIC